MEMQFYFFAQVLGLFAGFIVINGQLACPYTYRCQTRGYTCSMVLERSGLRIPTCIKSGLNMQGYPTAAGTGLIPSRFYQYPGRRYQAGFWGQNPTFRRPYTGGFWDRLTGGAGIGTEFGHSSQPVAGDSPVVLPNINEGLPSRPNVEDTASTNNNVNIVNNNVNTVDRSDSGNVQVNQHSTSNTASGPAVDPNPQPMLPDPVADPGFKPVILDPVADPGFRPVIHDPVADPGFHPVLPDSVDHGPGNRGILLGPVKPHVM